MTVWKRLPAQERIEVARWLELTAVFVLIPVVLLTFFPAVPVLLGLAIVAVGCAFVVKRSNSTGRSEPALRFSGWRHQLVRFALASIPLVVLSFAIEPEGSDASNPTPSGWIVFLLVYPVLSVFPQELVFRSFFFCRYTSLFRTRQSMIVASATAFSFAHIVYGNIVAVALTFAGGLIFAKSYAENRSLPIVCVEHTAYGLLVVLLGFGPYLGFE